MLRGPALLCLACAADFRVGCPEARFSANFALLGFHQGFGLSITLPAIVGPQRGMELLYTGRRIDGTEAASIGLVDRLVAQGDVRAEAHALAAEIARAAPLAVDSIRQTLRGHLADEIRAVTRREDAAQARLRAPADFAAQTRLGQSSSSTSARTVGRTRATARLADHEKSSGA